MLQAFRTLYGPVSFGTLLFHCIFSRCLVASGTLLTHIMKSYSTRANVKPDSHKFFLRAGISFHHRRPFELCHLAHSLMFQWINPVPFIRRLDEIERGSWYKSKGRNGLENMELEISIYKRQKENYRVRLGSCVHTSQTFKKRAPEYYYASAKVSLDSRVLFALTQQCLLGELPFPAHFRIQINYDCFNVIILAEAHINRTDNLPRIISHNMISSSLNNGSNTHCHTHCRKDL